MQIVVKANPAQKSAFQQLLLPDTVQVLWYEESNHQEADAYFDCCFDKDGWAFKQIQHVPVFVDAVTVCADTLPKNAIRINAWDGFLNRPVWEIAAHYPEFRTHAETVLHQMQQSFEWVPDQPGLIAARVISMIINEAFFALGDGVSTKDAIDTAMKLGTNYPFGPFEWADNIGIGNIIALLDELSKTNDRYQPSSSLLSTYSIMHTKNSH